MATFFADNNEVMSVEEAESTVTIPVSQYTKCIIAIQKLEDIKRVAYVNNNTPTTLIECIRAICKKEE